MQGGEYYVVDVNSGSVHIVDDLIYNMIDNDNKLSSKESLIEKLKDKYPVEEIEEAYEDLLQLVEEAKKHNIKIVFVAPQFSQKSAKTISQNVGANVVSINPLSDDWYNNMLLVANEIAKSYKWF